MGKNYVIVYFRVVAMLMILLFHCFCYNLGIWSNLPSLQYPHSYLMSPVILSTIGLSVFVIISGYLYGFGFSILQSIMIAIFYYERNSLD